MSGRPDLEAVREAQRRIAGHVHRTPVMTCATLDRMAGAELHFKCENLQKAGAFKSRGACNAVFSLDEELAAKGVVTHSSGNHAAALARAAALRGIAAYIVMPTGAPRVKVAAVEGYGGRITFCEPTLGAREGTAAEVMERTGATMIHPYDDARIIAGQGTCALELLEERPELEAIVVPVGGGGLLAGTLVAAKALCPGVKVYGAEPERVDDAYRSVQAGRIVTNERTDTVADGLRTNLGRLTFPIIAEMADEILLAGEDEILRATRLVLERAKLVVEPSSAVPLAAMLRHASVFAGRKVGVVLSGGNLDWDHLPAL